MGSRPFGHTFTEASSSFRFSSFFALPGQCLSESPPSNHLLHGSLRVRYQGYSRRSYMGLKVLTNIPDRWGILSAPRQEVRDGESSVRTGPGKEGESQAAHAAACAARERQCQSDLPLLRGCPGRSSTFGRNARRRTAWLAFGIRPEGPIESDSALLRRSFRLFFAFVRSVATGRCERVCTSSGTITPMFHPQRSSRSFVVITWAESRGRNIAPAPNRRMHPWRFRAALSSST